MKDFIEKVSVLGVGVVAACYLLNLGWGFIELIPDNVPVIGNLDDAAAAALLLSALAYFGVDLTHVFKVRGKPAKAGAQRSGAQPAVVVSENTPPAPKRP